MDELLYTDDLYVQAEEHRKWWYEGIRDIEMAISWNSLPQKVKDSWVGTMLESQSNPENQEECV